MRRFILEIAGLAMAAALVSACGGSDHDNEPATLVEVAQQNGFSALIAAAQKAGLDDDLGAASASLTVFAPTNAAFNTLATQLGLADGPALVAALDGPTLAKILSYHVLPTKKVAADFTTGPQTTIYTFGGAATTLALNTTSGVVITDAALRTTAVTTANVAASNGVIHVIDKVLVPPGVLNVVQMAQSNPGAFSSLVGAVVSANLAVTLSGTGPFTVFAPTNAAFAAAPAVSAQDLPTVLTYHVLADEVLSSELGPVFGTPVTTVSGQSITINAGTAPVIATITDTTATAATITAVDVRASNGVVHVIDKVLIPSLGN